MSISLKINIVSNNTTKTMRFSPEMSVGEVLQQIQEKVGEGGQDHGLYQSGLDGKTPCRWLLPEKSLQYYDISSDSTIDYKKKHRPQKIKLLDETIKTQLIDESTTVAEIVDIIAKKMGIKNPEEYSLMREKQEDTTTNKKDKKKDKENEEEDHQSGEWLKSNQILSEQGVPETEILILKKKFFFNDANIDRNDPVQLHLLYVQCRDAIVEGKYPTQREEAIQLAAIQCQVAHGDHAPQKHVSGFLVLKDYLPLQWAKSKNSEKDLYKEHRKLVSMTEVNAKYRYVQLCRSLKTYGMTSFACKFRIGKKLIDMTLGITREQMILIQVDTQEVFKSHPLKHIRRWACNEKSFTLDFGDHEQEYLILYMNKPEEVSSLISGYIEIIMKSRRDPSKTVAGDDNGIAVEEVMAVKRGSATTSQSISYGGGNHGGQPNSLSPSQQIPITDLKSALRATDLLIGELGQMRGITPGGALPQTFSRSFTTLTPQQYKHQLISHSNAIAAAAQQLLNDMSTPAQGGMSMTHQAMIKRAQVIMAELSTVGTCAKNAMFVPELASFSDEIIAVATRLSESMSKLMGTATTLGDKILDDAGKTAAQHQVFATHALATMMAAAVENSYVTESSSHLINECVRSVVSAINMFTTMATEKNELIDDELLHQQLQVANVGVTLAGDQLLTVTENVSTTASHVETRKLLDTLLDNTNQKASHLMTSFKSSDIPKSEIDLLATRMQDVSDTLTMVGYALDCVEQRPVISGMSDESSIVSMSSDALTEEFATLSNDLTNSVMILRNNLNNTPESILESFRVIAGNSNRLISCTKSVAARSDITTQQRLFNSTRAVFESISHLSAACKTFIKNPDDKIAHGNVLDAAGHLVSLTQNMSADAGKIASIVALRDNSKDMISYVSALMATARQSAVHLPDTNSMSLVKASKDVSDSLSKLMVGIKRIGSDPKSEKTQLELLDLSQKNSLAPMNLVSTSKRLAPKINDPNVKQKLVYASDSASQSVQRLMKTCETYKKICGHAEIEESLEQFDSTLSELETLEIAIQGGFVDTVPGQTRDSASEMLMVAIKDLNRVNTDLTTEIRTNPSRLGDLVKESTSTANMVAMAARSLISTTPGKMAQKKLLGTVKQLTIDMQQLVRASRSIATNPGDPGAELILDAASADVQSSVASLVAASAHIDCKELDEATIEIGNCLSSKLGQASGTTGGELSTIIEEFTSSTKALNAVILQLVSMARNRNVKGLGASAKIMASTVNNIVQLANNASQSNECTEAVQQAVLAGTSQLCQQSITLLDYAKARVANAKDPIYDQNLLQVAKVVEDSTNKLTRAIGGAGSGVCDEAVDIIIDATRLLDRTVQPETSEGVMLTSIVMQHQQSLLSLTNAAKELGKCSTDIVSSSRSMATSGALGEHSMRAANLVQEIITSTRSVVRSTVSSASPDILVPAKSILDATAIISSCIGAENSIPQIIQSARTVASSTTQLFGVSKERIAQLEEEGDEENKEELVRQTQQLATATTNLARGVKAVSSKEPNGQAILSQSVKELEDATTQLLLTTNSRGGASMNAKEFARLMQACRAVSSTSLNVIQSASSVSMKPKDSELQGTMNEAAISMSAAIKDVLKVGSGMMPGVLLCEEAIELVQSSLSDLSTMALSVAVGQQFDNPSGTTHLAAQEQMVDVTKSIGRGINELLKASRQSPEAIGQTSRQLAYIAPQLTSSTKVSLATTPNNDQEAQNKVITESKNLGDAILRLCQASLAASTAPSKETYQTIVTRCNEASEAMNKLVAQISSGVNLYRDLDDVLDSIKKSLSNISNKPQDFDESKSYQEYKDELTTHTKDLAIALKNVISTDPSNLVQISTISKDIATFVAGIAGNVASIMHSSGDQKVKDAILQNAKLVIEATAAIVGTSKQLSRGLGNSMSQNESFKSASDGISRFLQSIKQGAIGEIQSDLAIDNIKKLICDLDAYSLFAAAGQLESSSAMSSAKQQNHLKNLQKEIVTSAKLLIVTGSQLVGASRGSQEHLGAATTKFGEMVGAIVRCAREVASTLKDTSSQQDILSASKALSIASQQLVLAGKDAQRFKKDSTAFRSLGKAAEAVAEAVGQFISSVYFSISEAGKGIKELEKAQVVITSFVDKPDTVITNHKATAESFSTSVKDVAKSSMEIVTSYQMTQDDLVKASQSLVTNVQSLIANGKGAVLLFEGGDKHPDATKLTDDIKSLNTGILDLISKVRDQEQKDGSGLVVSEASRVVSERVHHLIQQVKRIPGGEKLESDEDDLQEDLELTAENELNTLTKLIEEATANLIASRPKTTKKAAGTPLDANDVAGIIVDASSSIATAVSKLVSMAAVAQSKRREQQQSSGSFYKSDPTWSNGLISAAKAVGGAVQMMIQASIKATQGKAEEEELIATAREVAASTARLVSASRAKSGDDPASKSAHQSLVTAAKAVTNAISKLLEAAKTATQLQEEEEDQEQENFNFTGSKIKELEQQMKILRLEKELNLERKRLLNSRKKEYSEKK